MGVLRCESDHPFAEHNALSSRAMNVPGGQIPTNARELRAIRRTDRLWPAIAASGRLARRAGFARRGGGRPRLPRACLGVFDFGWAVNGRHAPSVLKTQIRRPAAWFRQVPPCMFRTGQVK